MTGQTAPTSPSDARGDEWRLLRHPAADGAWNMAVDEAMARRVGGGAVPPTLRLYAWRRPAVSLGYLQPIRSDGLLTACACHGVAVVRRPTGGRAVLHDAELTYSAAVPLRGSWGGLTVAQSYRRLGEALCAGLARLGIAATLGGPSGPGAGGRGGVACFTARHAPAVLVEGRKLIGSAQRRWGDVLLQQGSILLRFNAALHQRLFPDWPREAPSRGVIWLADLLGEGEVDRIERALVAGWQQALGVRLKGGELDREERAAAERLRATRYETPEWTHRR